MLIVLLGKSLRFCGRITLYWWISLYWGVIAYRYLQSWGKIAQKNSVTDHTYFCLAHKPFQRPVRLPWHSSRRTLQARTLQILKNHSQPTPRLPHHPSPYLIIRVLIFFSVFMYSQFKSFEIWRKGSVYHIQKYDQHQKVTYPSIFSTLFWYFYIISCALSVMILNENTLKTSR